MRRRASKERGVRFGLNTLDNEDLLGISNGLLTASQLSTGRKAGGDDEQALPRGHGEAFNTLPDADAKSGMEQELDLLKSTNSNLDAYLKTSQFGLSSQTLTASHVPYSSSHSKEDRILHVPSSTHNSQLTDSFGTKQRSNRKGAM